MPSQADTYPQHNAMAALASPSVLPTFRVDGKVALVTGAGRGIGAAIALGLAQAGAQLVLVSRTLADLQRVAAQIERAGGQALIRPCDVTDSAAICALIDDLTVLDIVVNSAGEEDDGAVVDVTDEHLDAILGLNTRSVFVVAQAAVKKMLQRQRTAGSGGVVINISSQHGQVGASHRALYCMTKHAVDGLTKAMAVELAPQGIRVNSIGPTFVAALPTATSGQAPVHSLPSVDRIPIGRMAAATDVAAAAIFLASPAAAMVTGTCLLVDGGWTAQ